MNTVQKLGYLLAAELRTVLEPWYRVLAVAGGLGIALVVSTILNEPDSRARLSESIAGVGGLVVLLGLYIAYRRIQVQENQLQVQQAQLQVQERGQITDRYSKAVEQLAEDDKLAIRLGGIFALEKIAMDNSKDYLDPVVEVLCAFVRERHPVPREDDAKDGPAPTEVNAICSVLCRLTRRSEAALPISLQGTYLHSVLMPFCNLANANLSGANLTRANLTKANLTEANLTKANLTEASVTHSFLKYANLTKANLTSANLTNSNFYYANLTGANLTRAKLTRAALTRADYDSGYLGGLAGPKNADLTGTNLTDADIPPGQLTKTQLEAARNVPQHLKDAVEIEESDENGATDS